MVPGWMEMVVMLVLVIIALIGVAGVGLHNMMPSILRLICEWRGHDEEDYHPDGKLDLRPGRIVAIPTPNLVVHLPVPEMPPTWVLASLPEERRNFIIERVMMLRLNPPVILRRTYCRRCGEAW